MKSILLVLAAIVSFSVVAGEMPVSTSLCQEGDMVRSINKKPVYEIGPGERGEVILVGYEYQYTPINGERLACVEDRGGDLGCVDWDFVPYTHPLIDTFHVCAQYGSVEQGCVDWKVVEARIADCK